MFYVYLIQRTQQPEQRHIGFTADLKSRIEAHDRGQSSHTAKYTPWPIARYHAFEPKETARAFEASLKSGSGCAFAQKHFWQHTQNQQT